MCKLRICVCVLLLLSACTQYHRGSLHKVVAVKPQHDLQLSEINIAPQQYYGSVVRWGGEVVSSELMMSQAGKPSIRIEIVERDVDEKARPLKGSSSDGRFVAYIPQPEKDLVALDGHLITLVGTLNDTEILTLANKRTVVLPVIASSDYYIWHSSQNIYHDYYYTPSPFRFCYPHWWLQYGYHEHNHFCGDRYYYGPVWQP